MGILIKKVEGIKYFESVKLLFVFVIMFDELMMQESLFNIIFFI